MDQSILSSRAIAGMYYARLENPNNAGWIARIANRFTSDQASETYAFLGQTPRMREWIGGRQAKGLRGNSLTISNVHYEATLEIDIPDMRRDKTPQIRARVEEFADEGEAHLGTLLTALLLNGPSTVCYDGQYFFDTDHVEGDSGTQDNDITADISTYDSARDVVTNPTAIQMQAAIVKGVAQILSFKDDRGRPMNSNAKNFVVLVPVGLYIPALAAVSDLTTAAMQQNINPNALPVGMRIEVEMLPELTWTDSFAVMRTDSPIKGLILQEETKPELKVKDEQSEFAFDNDAIQLGIDAWRGADYGLWQRACYVTMI